MTRVLVALCLVFAVALPVAADEATPVWDIRDFVDNGTIEIRTVSDDQGEYWFPVWVVVIDDAVMVRLGSRAAERFRMNSTFPDVGVRVADKQFDRVHTEPSKALVDAVNKAMADKYWTDIFVRWLDHPLTLRLFPLAGSPVADSRQE